MFRFRALSGTKSGSGFRSFHVSVVTSEVRHPLPGSRRPFGDRIQVPVSGFLDVRLQVPVLLVFLRRSCLLSTFGLLGRPAEEGGRRWTKQDRYDLTTGGCDSHPTGEGQVAAFTVTGGRCGRVCVRLC